MSDTVEVVVCRWFTKPTKVRGFDEPMIQAMLTATVARTAIDLVMDSENILVARGVTEFYTVMVSDGETIL